ncbi:MAG: hypothetical protein HY958_09130 [Bacteroidia bacterium]|nr:hypothetical protein [Bacteroidia bacterium]
MKKPKFIKKLVLNKDTIARLNNEETNAVRGGGGESGVSCWTVCQTGCQQTCTCVPTVTICASAACNSCQCK